MLIRGGDDRSRVGVHLGFAISQCRGAVASLRRVLNLTVNSGIKTRRISSPIAVHLMQAILQNNCKQDKLRVHDVGPISQTLRMASALW